MDSGRAVRFSRPDKQPWDLILPPAMDTGEVTAELVDYVTTQYLLALPNEAVRLGWEKVYALVRLALLEIQDEAGDGVSRAEVCG